MRDLKINLLIQAIDRITAPIRRIGGGLHMLQERVEGLDRRMHKMRWAEGLGLTLLTGGAFEAGRAIFELTAKTAEYGVASMHGAQKAGLLVDQFQKLQAAAARFDIDPDAIPLMMGRFNRNIIQASTGNKPILKALATMGISRADVQKHWRDPNEMFLRFADGFSKLPRGIQSAVAMPLLGRGGLQAIPMLSAGRKQIEAYMREAEQFHLVIGDGSVEASERFVQSQKRMGMAVTGFQRQLGAQLMPVLTNTLEKFTDFLIKMDPKALQQFSNSIAKITDQLPAFLNLLGQTTDWATSISATILTASDKVGGFDKVLTAVSLVLGAQFAISAGAAIAKVVSLGWSAVVAAGQILTLIPSVTGLTDVFALFDIVADANPIGLTILAITTLIGLATVVMLYWKPIAGFFGMLWDKLKGVFVAGANMVWNALPPWFKGFLQGGVHVLRLDTGRWTDPTTSQLHFPNLGPPRLGPPIGSAHPAPAAGHAAPPAGGRLDIHVHDNRVSVKAKSTSASQDWAIHRGALAAQF